MKGAGGGPGKKRKSDEPPSSKIPLVIGAVTPLDTDPQCMRNLFVANDDVDIEMLVNNMGLETLTKLNKVVADNERHLGQDHALKALVEVMNADMRNLEVFCNQFGLLLVTCGSANEFWHIANKFWQIANEFWQK